MAEDANNVDGKTADQSSLKNPSTDTAEREIDLDAVKTALDSDDVHEINGMADELYASHLKAVNEHRNHWSHMVLKAMKSMLYVETALIALAFLYAIVDLIVYHALGGVGLLLCTILLFIDTAFPKTMLASYYKRPYIDSKFVFEYLPEWARTDEYSDKILNRCELSLDDPDKADDNCKFLADARRNVLIWRILVRSIPRDKPDSEDEVTKTRHYVDVLTVWTADTASTNSDNDVDYDWALNDLRDTVVRGRQSRLKNLISKIFS